MLRYALYHIIMESEAIFMEYREPYGMQAEIHLHDVDLNRCVSPGAMMRLFHTCADNQMRDEGLSVDAVRDNGMAMILSRLTLRFYAPVLQNDTLLVQSWPCVSRGFSMERCYRAVRDGQAVCEGESAWALVDLATRRLCKSDRVDFSGFTFGPRLGLRLEADAGDAAFCDAGTQKVRYSQTDLNRHMNNTRYLDMLCDFVPQVETRRILGLRIHYRGEAPLGSRIQLSRAQRGDAFFFRTTCEGAPNIEAALVFAPQEA